jgi:hypothetical protein
MLWETYSISIIPEGTVLPEVLVGLIIDSRGFGADAAAPMLVFAPASDRRFKDKKHAAT